MRSCSANWPGLPHAQLYCQCHVSVAEGVDERVDPAAGRLTDPLGHTGPVLDREDTAILQPRVVPLARQPDHRRAVPSRELHGKRPDSARRTGDDDRVARAGVHREHGRVGRRSGHVQRPGNLPGQPRRTGHQMHVVDHHELRMAGPPVSEAQHLITHRKAPDVRAGLHHDTGQIAALPGGKRRRPASVQRARADVRLAGLNPGRADLDQHLPGTGHRPFHILHPQHIDPAVLVKPHRPHCVITALSRPDKAWPAARQRADADRAIVQRSGVGPYSQERYRR